MEPEYITSAEMRAWLREALKADAESSLLSAIARGLRDPAAPAPDKRLHPLWLTLALLAAFAVCVFVGFTLLRLSPK